MVLTQQILGDSNKDGKSVSSNGIQLLTNSVCWHYEYMSADGLVFYTARGENRRLSTAFYSKQVFSPLLSSLQQDAAPCHRLWHTFGSQLHIGNWRC